MKRILPVIFITLLLSSYGSQNKINGNWVLNKSWFTDSTIYFIKADKNEIWPYYTFSEDHKIKHIVPNSKSCQVGETIIFNGKWLKNEDHLSIDLKGKIISVKTFHYRLKYKITENTTDKLTLQLDSSLIIKELSPNDKISKRE